MPSPKIDRDVVIHVAKLASLSLSETETDRFASELDRIVSHVQELEQLDTRGVPPTAHVQIDRMPLRSDDQRPGLSHTEALSQAPRVEDESFAVPTFVD
jgi:aspartyl-tRNA(Asn)/glutamyl-tRNA(Gln) amidotransferase subunit C